MSSGHDHFEEFALLVPGMTCGHCESAVRSEIEKLPGIDHVHVDLETKAVIVHGTGIDRAAVIAAVDEAGFEAVTGNA
jgi:copper chaperone